MRTGPPRRRRVEAVILAVVVVLLLASCGLPGDGDVEQVSNDAVPYELLEPVAPSPGGDVDDGGKHATPKVFWLLDDDRLISDTAAPSCGEEPSVVVERVLEELAAGPGEDARAAGRSTAIPPESVLALVRIDDGGTAEVMVDPETAISPDRLPAAVGQIVLTVTSAPGVRSVVLVSSTEPVPVPLPGGPLAEGPVTAKDYADLLVDPDSAAEGCPER